jgi:hypothetical protein
MHGPGSRNKLTPSHARLYPGDDVLDVLGRAVCAAGGLPRKELHEAWEMARRVRARFAGGRVVDLCAGYGLLAQVMVLLDPLFASSSSSSSSVALAVDVRLTPNHRRVRDAIALALPQLRGRVSFVQQRLERIALSDEDVVVSAHACGALSDDVLARAVEAGARVAVLPCCHQHRWRQELSSSPDPSLAMDLARCDRLRDLGYDVAVDAIPDDVSPKNRLLLAWPRATRPGVDRSRR